MFYFLDPLYFVILAPGIALSLWATFKVKSTFHKYNRVASSTRISGAEAARMLLQRNGVDIPVEEYPGQLTDHYDPRIRTLRLSTDVYRSRSIGAIGVAAHEAGHALQHATEYQPLMLRQSMAPIVSFGSQAWIFILMIGFFMGSLGLVKLGLILFGGVVVFQIITLPVELNASARAKEMVYQYGLVTDSERGGVARVLNAAAMTYVAAALTSVLTLLYYLIRLGLLGGRDD